MDTVSEFYIAESRRRLVVEYKVSETRSMFIRSSILKQKVEEVKVTLPPPPSLSQLCLISRSLQREGS